MARQNRVGSHKTSVKNDGGALVVTYHATDVVYADQVKIVLNTGGWFTPTTKTRMNQASNEHGLGFGVAQRDGRWFVEYKDQLFQFDGNTVEFAR